VVRHRGDPVLAWAIGNVVMESDANANIKPNKKKSSNKIDPAVAALMVRHIPGGTRGFCIRYE
jgi:phage terminase large subunit-like protein